MFHGILFVLTCECNCEVRMALYEVTLFGSYASQTCINRFVYTSISEPASVLGSFALAAAFGLIELSSPTEFVSGTVAYNVSWMLDTDFTFRNAVIRNLYSATDFYERPFLTPVPGREVGNGLSPMSAYGYRTNRIRLDVGRGYKRFAGVIEEFCDNLGVFNTLAQERMATVAASMSSALTYDDEGTDILFQPTVLSLEKYNPATGFPDEDGTARRLYPTLTEQMNHAAVGVTFEPYATVRTQNSRQYGRGI